MMSVFSHHLTRFALKLLVPVPDLSHREHPNFEGHKNYNITFIRKSVKQVDLPYDDETR